MRPFPKRIALLLTGGCRLRSASVASKVAILGALGAVLLWLLFALQPWHSPDLIACLRIRPGMTEAEVAALFGANAHADSCWLFESPTPSPFPGTPKYWYCDAGVVVVRFDSQGKALGVSSRSYEFRPKPSLWQRVLSWLGL